MIIQAMFRRLAATTTSAVATTRTIPNSMLLKRSSWWFSWFTNSSSSSTADAMTQIVSSQQQLVTMQRELVSSQSELVRKFDSQTERPRRDMAILIDAENNSHHSISAIVKEASRFGCATSRRIYGDWTRPQSQHWKSSLLEFAIVPIQQFSNSVGKNSSDSSMIIDAMDMLHSNKYDVFVIVSSDADFTRLATRIRENGKIVIGMGRAQTPASFTSACDKFITIKKVVSPTSTTTVTTEVTSSIPPETAHLPSPKPQRTTPPEQPIVDAKHEPAVAKQQEQAPVAKQEPLPKSQPNNNNNNSGAAVVKKKNGTSSEDAAKKALAAFNKAIASHADEHGWASLSHVGAELRSMTPKFDPRAVCGSSSLSKFVKFYPNVYEYKVRGRSEAYVRVRRQSSSSSSS